MKIFSRCDKLMNKGHNNTISNTDNQNSKKRTVTLAGVKESFKFGKR